MHIYPDGLIFLVFMAVIAAGFSSIAWRGYRADRRRPPRPEIEEPKRTGARKSDFDQYGGNPPSLMG